LTGFAGLKIANSPAIALRLEQTGARNNAVISAIIKNYGCYCGSAGLSSLCPMAAILKIEMAFHS